MEFNHIPILKDEIINLLNINPNGVYVDCTVGGAGHSSEIAKKLTENGILICFDKDLEALEISKERLSKFCCKKIFIHADFHQYKNKLEEYNIKNVNGVLIDLGVSSYQLDNADRGFSYIHNAKLDMRMDNTQDFSAYDVINEYSSQNLTKILYTYGEEPFTKNIVNNIIKAREIKPIETTGELAQIINNSVPVKIQINKSSLKRVFQAIRIEVNGELTNLDNTLKDIVDSLSLGGRFCVLTFHSLEDRIVKNVFKELSTDCICDKRLPICVCHHKASVKLVNRKPIEASSEEINLNSRSKSAKLRVVEKLF
mgnify:CR=1 FL=1